MGKGLVVPEPVQRLVTHKDYAVEIVNSIIKETNLDPYGQHSSKDLGASGLYYLSRALVRMKALQDRCVANEGVIWRFHKRQEIENKERDQYKEASILSTRS
ncbi:hypothetical protein SO802_012110 [Lithocarpus litseifolius]|uniref:Uncharacterized protein n=1 Tax=Lithocarpus litseifolius TaxID=425828 RepID=A0AAW2D378_9ROSI